MHKNDVCAVFTTFRPAESFRGNVNRIIQQVGLVVVVDDGALHDNVEKLSGWFSDYPNCVVHHNLYNSGIAYSLNLGVRVAQERGYKWVLLLDDDSVAPDNIVDILLQALKTIKVKKTIAIIGADYRLKGLPGGGAPVDIAPPPSSSLTRITAGSLLSTDVYKLVGGFNEGYFIDYVDIEFCLRATSAGYTIINVSGIGMVQPVGSELKRGLFTIRSQHNPQRQYYFFRNSIDVARKYWKLFPGFCLRIILDQIKTLIKIVFFQDQKSQRLILVFKALQDAYRGRFGKLKLPFEIDS